MDDWIVKLGYSKNLYRTVMNVYWINFLLIAFTTAVGFVMDYGYLPAALAYDVFKNTVLLFLILLITELNNRFIRLNVSFLTAVPGQIIAAIIVIMQPEENLIPLVYFLPLIIAMLTLRTSNILLNLGIGLLSYTLIYTFVPAAQDVVELSVQFTALITIFTFGLLLLYFNKILNQVFQQIQKKTEENQHLLVKNIDMDRLNKIDALTDCYNHKTFHEYLATLIQQADRHPFPLHLALLDIDDFKLVNDHFGHWVGDQVLKHIAAIIKENLLSDDYVFRYGGEEFAVLFLGISAEKAFTAAETIRRQVAERRHPDLNGRKVTISIGLKTYKQGEGKESLFRAADAALYEAKRKNKNQTAVS